MSAPGRPPARLRGARIPRFALPDDGSDRLARARPGDVVTLPPELLHHAGRVLRLAPGDPLELFDGRGAAVRAEWTGAAGRDAGVLVRGIVPPQPPPRLRLTLIQGLSAADRMDWCIEKAVELGVERIVPVACRHGTVRLDAARAERRLAHWQRIAAAAAQQSGRTHTPAVDALRTLAQYAAAAATDVPATARLVLDPLAALTLPAWAEAWAGTGGGVGAAGWSIAIACGPESGFDDDELQQLEHADHVPVRAGPRVLRTETAGPAALAALQALLGDWRDAPDAPLHDPSPPDACAPDACPPAGPAPIRHAP